MTLVGALVLAGGLAPRVSGAQEWHELYAAGKQALRNGQAERAAQLLRGAIQRRPQPGVAVPTYGTNFEPQYFPYLRLAEAYLRLEAYDDVLEVMKTSSRFGVEPASDRTVLENRARTALDAKRVTAPSVQSPPPSSAVPPPIPEPKSTVPTTTPKRDAEVPPAETTRATPRGVTPRGVTPRGATPPGASPRTSEPARTRQPTLDLTTQPPGALVFVDDEPVGRSDPQTGRLRLTTLGQGRHRLRLSADGHDDLVKEIVLASEPLSVHGVLSVSRAAAEVKEPQQSAPAIPTSPRAPWWLLGLVTAVLVPATWLWRRARLRNQPRGTTQLAQPSTPTPAAPLSPVITERGSFEHLPVEFGEYRLLRRIGKGGMATVYEAERGAGGERFALKRPLPGFLDDPRLIQRFNHEAELGRALHHPNIVRIVDRGQVDATPFFVMELIDGETLRERLDREGRLDPALATSLTAHVAEALDYAHHKGVIHRDLKPTNIMLERLGGLKVMDYGIARAQFREGLTTAGGFIGTPQYAAPEAAEGRTEPKSDVYSLGVVFFEMLTGSLPFPNENPYAALHNHRSTPPPAPSTLNYALTRSIDLIVLRLLSKEPSERPSAEELLNELTDHQEKVR